eukprot:c10379_g1_i1.p1 GENE.c10379_g1_i1~~c10379_g1_i1.p1  ORF type:complete len:487 (+),score=104.36 c10379_g1_i1:821-2281(+)
MTEWWLFGGSSFRARLRSRDQSRSSINGNITQSPSSQGRPFLTDSLACLSRNFGKGYVLGAGAKILYGLFNLARGRIPLSGLFDRVLFSQATSQWGLFGGGLLGLANTSLFCTKALANNDIVEISLVEEQGQAEGALARVVAHIRSNCQYYRGFVAGALAGLALLALPDPTRSSVAIFVIVRALEVQVHLAVRRGLLPRIPHADVLLMMASSAQVMWAWVFRPTNISSSYRSFLLTQGQIDSSRVDAVRSIQLGLPLNLNHLNTNRIRAGVPTLTDPFANDSSDNGWRDVMYFGQSWPAIWFSFLRRAVVQALQVYVPLYSFSTLVFSSRLLMANPTATCARVAENILRSSAFLVVYCSIGILPLGMWRVLGIRYDTIGAFAQILPALGGCSAGLATFIEKPSRRIELALFVCRHAVNTLFFPLVLESWRAPLQFVLFSVSLGHILHAMTRYPEAIRPTYLSLLRRFFATEDSIKITPSELSIEVD